jgi:hypothetical protein
MRAGGTLLDRGGLGIRFDVGTLWTLERDSYTARCALLWVPHAWELRVLIDEETLLSERCHTQAQVLAVANAWNARLQGCGWFEPGQRRGNWSGLSVNNASTPRS